MKKCNDSSRFTPRAFSRLTMCSFAAILFLTLCGFLSPGYGQWPKTVIKEGLDRPLGLYIADMDTDNDSDLVVAMFGSQDLMLYRNDNLSWVSGYINPNHNGAMSLDVIDMDDNGLPDVIAGSWTDIRWFQNSAWLPPQHIFGPLPKRKPHKHHWLEG